MTELARLQPWRHLVSGVVLLVFFSSLQADASEVSEQLSDDKLPAVAFLLGRDALRSPLATSAFTAPRGTLPAAQAFSGVLKLKPDSSLNRIEVLTDSMGIADEQQWKLTTLPPFSFDYVSDGDALIPLQREPQRSDHPYWEIIPGPGRVWVDRENTAWSRASLPFALKEKNQNCIHNGLMTFLYKADGAISRAAWQITSETCQYLKINLWGIVEAEYHPRPTADYGDVVAAYRQEQADRIPVKPIDLLAETYPAANPPAIEPSGIEDVTVYGFVIDGVHYRSVCQTRYGPYPFCDVLVLPSYSLAKSVFAGLGYMLLNLRWPEFADRGVTGLVPACNLKDKRWQNITTRHLVNMKTGLWDSTDFERDDVSGKMQTFFLAESDAEKTRFSCEAWPKKAAPGTVAVYHTSDTYLLGVAMNNFLKEKLGQQADIHTYLYDRFLERLQLSPLSRWTQRTYDARKQPFTGYGLIFQTDDISKIAQSLNLDSSPDYPLAGMNFEAALQRGPLKSVDFVNTFGDLTYNNGFWGLDVAESINCSVETRVPFMSGYGGIVVAMFPNGSIYYHFSDGGQYSFKHAAVEANKALNYCEES